MGARPSLFPAREIPTSLREFADALDADRGHGKSYVTLVMRDAADEIEKLRGAIHSAVSFTYIDTEAARLQARVDLKRAAGWPLTDGEEPRLALLRAKALESVTTPDPETPDFEVDDGFGI